MTLKELYEWAQDLSEKLNDEKLLPCQTKDSKESSCMAKARQASDEQGATFEEYDKHVSLCPTCKAYWLSCRLASCMRNLAYGKSNG